MLNSAFAEGQFGSSARDASVIYGQTDSLFVAFPSCSVSLPLQHQSPYTADTAVEFEKRPSSCHWALAASVKLACTQSVT